MGLGGLCSSLTSMEILQEFTESEKIRKDMNFEVLTEGWKQRQLGRGSDEDSQGNLLRRVTVGKGPS